MNTAADPQVVCQVAHHGFGDELPAVVGADHGRPAVLIEEPVQDA